MDINPDTGQPNARDEFVLSTGRVAYALSRTVGMGPIEPRDGCAYPLMASGGYDDMTEWTPAEREELAGYMIALWTNWKALQKQTTYPLSCCEFHRP